MTPQAMSRLQLLIRYLIQRAKDEDIPITITKLVKLLYLMDVEYFRATRKSLTELDWYFYFYGPYDKTIEEAISGLGYAVDERPGVTPDGRAFRRFYSNEYESIELDPAYDWVARSVIDDQWRDWAEEDLNKLLSHVYFETEPMSSAKPMERLDFSGVQPRPRVKSLMSEPVASRDVAARLRANLAERNAERDEEVRYQAEHGRPLPAGLSAAYDRAVDLLSKEAGNIPTGLEGRGPTWYESHSEE